jgi:hypothetical protein
MSKEPVRRQTDQPKETLSRAERRLRAIKETISLVNPDWRAALEKMVAQIPLQHRLGYLRAIAGLASPRQEIKAYCLMCVSWERQEVAQCTNVLCPHYLSRPYQDRLKGVSRPRPLAEG